MMKQSLIPVVLALAASVAVVGPASAAGNCDALRSQIEARIAASGVANFTVTTVETSAASGTRGKVVGSCEMGAKSIVYQQLDSPTTTAASTTAAVPRPKKDVILTECKDGSVLANGDCKN